MKSSLQLNLSQTLKMTPQLQQAIRLLQLSTLELEQEIQAMLDENPLLEIVEHSEDNAFNDDGESQQDVSDGLQETESDLDPAAIDSATHFEQAKLTDELIFDSDWDEIYSSNTGQTGLQFFDELPIYQGETTDNLNEHLLWQLSVTPFSEIDRTIALAIIEALDDSGYLTEPLEILQKTVGNAEVELNEIEAVLKRIQHFDPIGIAARNLQECLLVQLSIIDPLTPYLSQAKTLLEDHIDTLAKRDLTLLLKRSKLSQEDLQNALALIQQLDPKPGERVQPNNTQYIYPDVTVTKHAGEWRVKLTKNDLPSLKLSDNYAQLSSEESEARQYIREKTQQAKWFMQALTNRKETLLKVSSCIMAQQIEFLELGEKAMKPMILSDIAALVDMHESTISRATTQKFIHTPHGIFELKYFFSSQVSNNGDAHSSTAIRAMIKELIANEPAQKPLSDNKLAQLLETKGIKVARRTITKYRESLGIESSSARKKY